MAARQRVRQYPLRAASCGKPVGGCATAAAPLADLSCAPDLAVVELRAWLGHAAAVLSAEHAACHRRAVGRMERDFRGFLHSHIPGLWRALPEVSSARPAD